MHCCSSPARVDSRGGGGGSGGDFFCYYLPKNHPKTKILFLNKAIWGLLFFFLGVLTTQKVVWCLCSRSTESTVCEKYGRDTDIAHSVLCAMPSILLSWCRAEQNSGPIKRIAMETKLQGLGFRLFRVYRHQRNLPESSRPC